MNRRSFFRTIGIATAAVYLRLAPEKVAGVTATKGIIYGEFESMYGWMFTGQSTSPPDIWCSPSFRDELNRAYANYIERLKDNL